MSRFGGKLVMKITRDFEDDYAGHPSFKFDVRFKSGAGEYPPDEEFSCLSVMPKPQVAYKLKPGEWVRIACNWEIEYYRCGEYGEEWDFCLMFWNEKTLNRGRIRERYISKGKR